MAEIRASSRAAHAGAPANIAAGPAKLAAGGKYYRQQTMI
jgi:hypothetical protein